MLRDLELLQRVIWIGDESRGCATSWGKCCALGGQHLLNFLSYIFPHSCLIAVREKKERKNEGNHFLQTLRDRMGFEGQGCTGLSGDGLSRECWHCGESTEKPWCRDTIAGEEQPCSKSWKTGRATTTIDVEVLSTGRISQWDRVRDGKGFGQCCCRGGRGPRGCGWPQPWAPPQAYPSVLAAAALTKIVLNPDISSLDPHVRTCSPPKYSSSVKTSALLRYTGAWSKGNFNSGDPG